MDFEGFDRLRKLTQQFSKFSALAKAADPLPASTRSLLDAMKKHETALDRMDWPKKSTAFLEATRKADILSQFGRTSSVLDRLRQVNDAVNNNPELQFISIADLQLLSLYSTDELKESMDEDEPDAFISFKEEIIDQNLLPYLEELNIADLWLGANYSFNDLNNPDRLRHTLISLRTLLEHLIEGQLAPNELLEQDQRFAKEFKSFHAGKKLLDEITVSRKKRIEYFASRVEFGVLGELTKEDIELICECYRVLCDIHNPKIMFSENQVRILKMKTGITLWLLAYINEEIKRPQ